MKHITKQTYQLFWQHVRRYRGAFWLIVSTITIGAALEVVTPLYYKRFFDVLATTELARALVVPQLAHILFVILGINALMWLMYRVATFTNNFFQPRIFAELSNTCFEYLHRHSFGFFSNRFVGALVKRVGRLVGAFEDITDMFLWEILRTVVRLSFILVVLFLSYPVLGALLSGWLILYLTINYFLSLQQLKFSEVAAKADSAVSGYLADTVMNQSTVKLFTAHSDERRAFGQLTEERFQLDRRSWNFDSTIEAVQVAFMVLLEFAIFYAALRLWRQGAVTIGDFVLVQVYVIRVFDQLWGVGRVIRRMYRRFGDAAEMVEILNEPHQVQDRPGATTLQVPRGALEFTGVNFTYIDSHQVIKNFSLRLAPGEHVGLVGPSGAGKSTLVALLLRFYDLTSGEITIDGQNVTSVTQDSLRQRVSFVPQDPVLFHRTLIDNIRYGRRDATDAEVVAAAKQAHCDEFISKLPRGYQTFVGERGVKLSGGERQRVAIARAILKNAPILVLDEATSSLDSQTEALIQDALATLMRGKTTLVIAHRLSTIMKLDRIVVVRDGAVQEEGNHAELIEKKGGLYKTLWGLQAGGFIA